MPSDPHAQALARECKALFRKHCRAIADDVAPPFPAEVHADGNRVVALINQLAALSAQTPGEGWMKFAVDLVGRYVDEAKGVLDEAYRFESNSPKTRENINAAMDLLDDILQAMRSPLPKPPATPGEAA